MKRLTERQGDRDEIQVRPSAIARTQEMVRQSGHAQSDLVFLMRGEPDFATPTHIRQALIKAVEAGYTHYPPVEGYPDLRQAIAEQMEREAGIDLHPSQILVTTGATMGMYVALQAILERGDEVLLPAPIYDVYQSQIVAVGAIPVAVEAQLKDDRFQLNPALLAAALTERTRAVILNTPWNPTGTVMTEEELRGVGEFAVANELYVIVDEIYEKLVYDEHRHYHLAGLHPSFRPWTITINSFSKTYAMTGWRLGYNIADAPLVDAMLTRFRQSSRGASAFVQRAGLAALAGPQDTVEEMVGEYRERRRLLVELVDETDGIRALPPEGTFFCLVDVSELGYSSEVVARTLLNEFGLVTVPGAFYGSALAGFLRLSFSYSSDDIRKGVRRLAEGISFLRRQSA